MTALHTKLHAALKNRSRMAGYGLNMIFAAVLLLLLIRSPVVEAYQYPNDFTNHQDFQYKYLDRSLSIDEADHDVQPKFYSKLKSMDPEISIIEFPAVISWAWNVFHIYQSAHGKRVKVGYEGGLYSPFFGYDAIENRNVRFYNFVDLSKRGELIDSGADYVVLHKNVWKESMETGLNSPEQKRNISKELSEKPGSLYEEMREYVSLVSRDMELQFGDPVFQDPWIIVYAVK